MSSGQRAPQGESVWVLCQLLLRLDLVASPPVPSGVSHILPPKNWRQTLTAGQAASPAGGVLGAVRAVQPELSPPLPPCKAAEGRAQFVLGISLNTLFKVALHLILSGSSQPLEKYSSGLSTVRLTFSLPSR